MATVTYLTRAPLMVLVGKVKLSRQLENYLKFMPVAILTALVVPGLVVQDQQLNLAWDNPYLPAAFVAGLLAWRTKNVFWAMIGGVATVIIVRALLT